MKYTLTENKKVVEGITLSHIMALEDIPRYGVKTGDLGGWIEKEANLSQNSDAWVYGDAQVYGNARVYGNAQVYGNARVYGNAQVYGNAWVYGNALVTQGHYTSRVLTITLMPYQITAIYPNHVQIGCKLFEICGKRKAISAMADNGIDHIYYARIWLAVQLCKQWIKDNPEPLLDGIEKEER